MNWIEKYRPIKFEEVRGQDSAVSIIKDFIKTFPTGKKAIILHGTPGVGKTTLAIVAANESDSELFELNASDLRDKKRLEEVLRPAMEQVSLFKRNKIILVDEVDGLSANDRGGLPELLDLIKNSQFPLLITANDIWDKKFNPLRKEAQIIKLKEIDYKTIKNILIEILKKENLFVKDDVLTSIAAKSKGDLRAAINDLQTVSKLSPSEQEKILFDERNKEVDIFNALKEIFQTKPNESMLGLYDSVNMSLDEIMLWVEENVPLEYKGEELAKAYDRISKADVFRGRIYKQQYWRFLVYQNILLSYGISSAKGSIKRGFTSYKRPSRILKIWMHNQRNEKKKSIAQKYAKQVHVGEKRALKEFETIRLILNNPVIQKDLKLTEDEIKFLEEKNQKI